ncbi:hypothetical protein Hanom_Chr09g00864621 [Helianthus anomalus]
MFYFYKNIYIKKTGPSREECRHQIEGMGGVKGGVDVARGDWVCVREGTPLRDECPPQTLINFILVYNLKRFILLCTSLVFRVTHMCNKLYLYKV